MRLVLLSSLALVACQRADEKKITTVETGSGSNVGSAATPDRNKPDQVTPPLDLAMPPLDAVKTRSGLIYKKLTSVPDAPFPKRNDTVMIVYTGWRQSTGETFYTNRGTGQPLPLALSNTAPGFTEAMQLVRKGEKAMLWLPPEIGFKGAPPAGTTPETLVYEVEVTDIVPAPAVPDNVGKPPATAQKLKSGLPYVVVKTGTAKDKARNFDTVTFNYSAWEENGRMFDSTELRKRPATVQPFRQNEVMEELLTSAAAGERIRCWIPSEKMTQSGKPLPGLPAGTLTYEIEMLTIAKGNEPPPVPRDVAKPPADATRTESGLSYKLLKAGKGGPHPGPTDAVKVHYTGWTTDGRIFDSSVVKGEASDMRLDGVIAGFTEGLQLMSPGDKVRFWIPEALAYKGAQGRPQGMLVFDLELVEIKAGPPVEKADPNAPAKAESGPSAEVLAWAKTPPDVAAPPADAKKTPKGVSYKILKSVPGAPHPKATDIVTIDYTGWTTDGQMFESSKKTGKPLVYPLQKLIPGWVDAIQQLGVGESARLWIPEELAYKGVPGRPQGMLVFDVDVIDTKAQ